MKGTDLMSAMKRVLSILMAALLILSQATLPALAESDPGAEDFPAEEAEAPKEEEIEYPDELIVGHPTITRGDFFTEMFGNDTADIDVRALIHGYNLVNWDQNQGVYLIDPSVVTNVLVIENEDGDRTYFMALADDLYYSDGTPITAWDYAFSTLLMMSPEIEQIGGKIYRAEHILGYKEYLTGKSKTLIGLEVLSDHQLAITLDHNFLPYFFEIGLLLTVPYPIGVIAPGCKVYDDGEGCYIGNADPSVTEPIFTAELLKKTIMDPDTGYNSHPSVSSGPYVMTDYDYETAHFVINEYYKGAWMYSTLPDDYIYEVSDYSGVGGGTLTYNSHTGPNIYKVEKFDDDGNDESFYLVKPTIERICFTVADNDTMAEDLSAGKLHLVNKVVYGPTIMECMGITTAGSIIPVPDHEAKKKTEEETDYGKAEINRQNYPRIGLAFLTFSYDWPTVHEMEVRQAIAWCMDRAQLTEDYCQGYGMVVNGYYGIEQWEYLICTQQLEYPVTLLEDETSETKDKEGHFLNMYAKTEEEYDEFIAEWESLNLDNLVNYNVYDLVNDPERTEKAGISKANKLLDGAGWTLNREGGTYDPETDDVRCKMVDGELVALDLTLMYPRGNHIVDTIQENFFDNLAEAGIKVTLVPEDMEELFKYYYHDKERTTDMIYLATNFHVVVDPSITYSTDTTAGHLMWNNTYSDDEELYNLAVDMRKTEPGNTFVYVSKWIDFQERYNEVLPTIPLYSNIYFDFYTPQLRNYNITAHVTWTQAILEAYFGGDPKAEDEEDEEEFDEDELDDGEVFFD